MNLYTEGKTSSTCCYTINWISTILLISFQPTSDPFFSFRELHTKSFHFRFQYLLQNEIINLAVFCHWFLHIKQHEFGVWVLIKLCKFWKMYGYPFLLVAHSHKVIKQMALSVVCWVQTFSFYISASASCMYVYVASTWTV